MKINDLIFQIWGWSMDRSKRMWIIAMIAFDGTTHNSSTSLRWGQIKTGNRLGSSWTGSWPSSSRWFEDGFGFPNVFCWCKSWHEWYGFKLHGGLIDTNWDLNVLSYPLVIEHSYWTWPTYSEFSHWTWWFSGGMLFHQRQTCPTFFVPLGPEPGMKGARVEGFKN